MIEKYTNLDEPTIKYMDAVTKYIKAAARHGEETQKGDAQSTNRAYGEIMEALSEMKKGSDGGKSALSVLVKNENTSVVCWAATHLLPLDEHAAKEALKDLAENDGTFVGLNAKWVLHEWDAGQLRT